MKLTIKDSWDQVTLEDFCMLQSLLLNDTNDSLSNKVDIICLLTGKPKDYFTNWRSNEIISLYETFDFIYTEPEGEIQPYYTIGGKEYKLITTLKELSYGHYQTLKPLIENREEIFDNLDQILANLLIPTVPLGRKKRLINRINKVTNSLRKTTKQASRSLIQPILPISEEYMKTPIEETAENIFKNISVSQAMGIFTFFFAYSNLFIECFTDSLTLTQNKQFLSALKSLKNQQETMNMQEIQIIEKNLQHLEDLENIGTGLQ